MNDPKDPFTLSRKKVFLWGSLVTALLCGLIFLYVPRAPTKTSVHAPLQGPGSQSASLDPAVTQAPQNSGAPSSVTEARGLDKTPAETTYTRFCVQCHGEDGRANTQIARMAPVKPTNLIAGPFKVPKTVEAYKALILNGQGAMPGFKAEMSETQAADVATYVLEQLGKSKEP